MKRSSWIESNIIGGVDDFSIDNIPFGIFSVIQSIQSEEEVLEKFKRVGSAIGNYAIDCSVLWEHGLLGPIERNVFNQPTLNMFMSLCLPLA